MNPLISIIIPTYNRAHLIEETLDSVLAQTYTNWECIVVDDGSTDNTDELLAEYCKKDSRFQYHRRPDDRPKGANACRNYGFELSKGEYVNWFDSDDLMDVNHIEKKVESILNKKCDFVICEVASFKQNVKNNKPIKNKYNGLDVQNQFIGKLTLFTPGPLWRKDFLTINKLSYEASKINTVLNDWVFGLDALMAAKNYYFIKEVLIYYRSHDNSIYSSRKTQDVSLFFNEFKVRKKAFYKVKKNHFLSKLIIDYYYSRILYILRSILYKRNIKKSFIIFIEILKINITTFNIISLFKVFLGYIFSVVFNRGYGLLKH